MDRILREAENRHLHKMFEGSSWAHDFIYHYMEFLLSISCLYEVDAMNLKVMCIQYNIYMFLYYYISTVQCTYKMDACCTFLVPPMVTPPPQLTHPPPPQGGRRKINLLHVYSTTKQPPPQQRGGATSSTYIFKYMSTYIRYNSTAKLLFRTSYIFVMIYCIQAHDHEG